MTQLYLSSIQQRKGSESHVEALYEGMRNIIGEFYLFFKQMSNATNQSASQFSKMLKQLQEKVEALIEQSLLKITQLENQKMNLKVSLQRERQHYDEKIKLYLQEIQKCVNQRRCEKSSFFIQFEQIKKGLDKQLDQKEKINQNNKYLINELEEKNLALEKQIETLKNNAKLERSYQTAESSEESSPTTPKCQRQQKQIHLLNSTINEISSQYRNKKISIQYKTFGNEDISIHFTELHLIGHLQSHLKELKQTISK